MCIVELLYRKKCVSDCSLQGCDDSEFNCGFHLLQLRFFECNIEEALVCNVNLIYLWFYDRSFDNFSNEFEEVLIQKIFRGLLLTNINLVIAKNSIFIKSSITIWRSYWKFIKATQTHPSSFRKVNPENPLTGTWKHHIKRNIKSDWNIRKRSKTTLCILNDTLPIKKVR